MRDANVVVIGGTGFIVGHLLRGLGAGGGGRRVPLATY